MSFPRPSIRRRTPEQDRPSAGHDDCALTDDALTVGPPTHTVSGYLREAVDRLAGADPGLTQLRNALQAVLGIALAVGSVDLFVHLTGALQLSAGSGPAPVVAAENHALLIVSMLLSGIVAMMAGFTVSDATARGTVDLEPDPAHPDGRGDRGRAGHRLLPVAVAGLPGRVAVGRGVRAALGPARVRAADWLPSTAASWVSSCTPSSDCMTSAGWPPTW